MLENSIIALLVSGSFIAGKIIALLAPEEVEPGKKYFNILTHVLTFIACIVASISMHLSFIFLGVVSFFIPRKLPYAHMLLFGIVLLIALVIPPSWVFTLMLILLSVGITMGTISSWKEIGFLTAITIPLVIVFL